MRVRYVNHKGKELDFMKLPYIFQSASVLNYTWNYEINDSKYNQVKNLKRAVTNNHLTVSVMADTEDDFLNAAYRMFEIVEEDTVAQVPGKLYVDDYYLKCYIVQNIPENWNMGIPFMKRTMYILPDYPYWCHEETKSFLKYNEIIQKSADDFLSYPFSYPYRYSMPRNAGFIQNDHYAPCDFQMIVYGPCTDPSIRIDGHLYEVITTLYSGEYMVIDSRDNTVTKYRNDGSRENLYNSRRKDISVFEKIPSGRCSVLWNIESFGFDITLFQERSEPKWSL